MIIVYHYFMVNADSSKQATPETVVTRRSTAQKRAILSALRSTSRPLGPSELHIEVQRTLRKIGIATIYRALKQLKEEGLVTVVQVPGHSDRYELTESADHHHHHFQCNECGKVFDIKGCLKAINSLLPKGFLAQRHEIIWYGECAVCTA